MTNQTEELKARHFLSPTDRGTRKNLKQKKSEREKKNSVLGFSRKRV